MGAGPSACAYGGPIGGRVSGEDRQGLGKDPRPVSFFKFGILPLSIALLTDLALAPSIPMIMAFLALPCTCMFTPVGIHISNVGT
ncbi:hypothetical protein DRO38_01955 [Candidatus Bathyarchaeota archaeon]|nr:MAG: hypothetical protein DRO38_01955 [Candidatus Bathyarchaeota archaeon]